MSAAVILAPLGMLPRIETLALRFCRCWSRLKSGVEVSGVACESGVVCVLGIVCVGEMVGSGTVTVKPMQGEYTKLSASA